MAKTISITSGKGGVGKTFFTANLANLLALQGKKVLCLDGDLGMSNLDLALGARPLGNLLEVLNGQKEIEDILTPVGPLISLISAGSGLVELNRLTHFERRSLIDAVSSLDHQFDYLLIDTAPGISDNVLALNAAAQIAAVIITPDPASFADSYALLKVLHHQHRESQFAIICNQVKDEADGQQIFQRFAEVVFRFLNVKLDYWGSVCQDSAVRKATQAQRLITRFEPQAEATLALKSIAQRMEASFVSLRPKTGIQFFWEQMVGVAS